MSCIGGVAGLLISKSNQIAAGSPAAAGMAIRPDPDSLIAARFSARAATTIVSGASKVAGARGTRAPVIAFGDDGRGGPPLGCATREPLVPQIPHVR